MKSIIVKFESICSVPSIENFVVVTAIVVVVSFFFNLEKNTYLITEMSLLGLLYIAGILF